MTTTPERLPGLVITMSFLFFEFVDRFQQRFRWCEPFSFELVERDRTKGSNFQQVLLKAACILMADI